MSDEAGSAWTGPKIIVDMTDNIPEILPLCLAKWGKEMHDWKVVY